MTDFERDSGIPCRFILTGAERDLDAATKLALYRVTQEALTNSRKHAQPGQAEVRLGYEAGGARLTVEDFSAADRSRRPCRADRAARPPDGGGYGLTGMRERAELLGGSLSATETGTGFRVDLWVPEAAGGGP